MFDSASGGCMAWKGTLEQSAMSLGSLVVPLVAYIASSVGERTRFRVGRWGEACGWRQYCGV